MKKHMIAFAAALTACACLADGQEFQSDLKFGWSADTVAPDRFKAYAVQFTDGSTDNEVAAVSISDVVTVASPRMGLKFGDTADQIWVWDTDHDQWKKYYCYGGRGTSARWIASDTVVTAGNPPEPTTDKLKLGQTFFFRRGTGSSSTGTTRIATSGSVVESATYEATVTAGQMAFLSYPWPVTFPIASLKEHYKTGSAPAGDTEFATSADQVWLWNGTGWTQYYYNSDVSDWCEKSSNSPTSAEIPVGTGFFFRRGSGQEDATISFSAQ